MGVVYEAEDTRLQRPVALKFLPETLVKDPRVLERFRREARAASQLNHPNICTIHDIEDNDGHPFIVMERLEGESLKQRLRSGALPLEEILEIAMQVSDALIVSHTKGIIHRDIKPANIFLTRSGQVKVLDFGLAKLAREAVPGEEGGYEDSLTQMGVIPGTAVYMSPEQARSEELDGRSDLFSFGVVLYEMATGKKPFSGTNIVTTLDAVLHQKPISPLSSNPDLPAELEAIIGRSLEKERTKRYQNAGEIKSDLQRLKRDTEPGATKSDLRSPLRLTTHTFARTSPTVRYLLLATMALLVTVLAALGAWWWRHRAGALGAENRNTIAVLPLQNINNDPSSDYLRFALADEIANVLTYNRSLDVRPTMSTRKFSKGEVDPQEVGRQLHVAIVMAGHFLRQESQILVTVEAIDVNSNRLLWESNLSAPAQDLIGLQSQLAGQVRQGLLPQLGAAGGFIEAGTKPKNQDAYDLYLRSLAVSHDPEPNKSGITILEETVALDPTYAPAWQALGLRYYYDAAYGTGGDDAFKRSNAAYERALSLDPNLIVAAGNLITNRVERGDLGEAYDAAKELAVRRPQSGTAHFVLSYVLRYAGVLDRAAGECDMALALDPGNFEFRSCAWVFLEQGRAERAMDFIRLDAGSEWATFMIPQVLLREGKIESARAAVGKVSNNNAVYQPDLFESCLAPRPGAEPESTARKAEAAIVAEPDPEPHYYHGALLAFCGQMEEATELIHSGIEKNYCASTALRTDPLLAKLRPTAAFAGLASSASDCQRKFRASIHQPLP